MFFLKPDSPLARQVLTGLALAALLILPVTAAFIDPIGTYAVGDNITVSGSTNGAVGNTVWVTVSASDFHPTSKYESIEQLSSESKASGTVRVTKGPGANGQNIWSIHFSTVGWETGEYTVRAADATGGTELLWATAAFTLVSDPAKVPQRTVSPLTAQDTLSPSAAEQGNSSGSLPGTGSTSPATTPQNNGDSGLSLPLLTIFGLFLLAGCGYYVMKKRPHQTTPSPASPVMKTENASTVEKYSTDVPNLIFLSAKSEDYAPASRVYSFLAERGYSVFFSDQTLPRMGNSDYRREIDKALEQAKHLILVTSRKEYVESKWVEAEWGSFINEKRSGRKDGNIVVLLAGSMQIGDLPISLRSFETRFLDNPKTLDQILSYLS
ncbi:MAG: TIR domain-containing protein [Methanoregula sp.]